MGVSALAGAGSPVETAESRRTANAGCLPHQKTAISACEIDSCCTAAKFLMVKNEMPQCGMLA